MKRIIASDIHGSAYYCEKLLDAMKAEKAERLILLGDILYHGPRNDLPREYNPKKVIAMLNAQRDKIICVQGNCDAEVDAMVLDFPLTAEYALMDWHSRRIFLTHGHKYNIDNLPALKEGDVLLQGHTHVPKWEKKNGIYIFNPGSVAIPKEGSHHGYMTFNHGMFRWKDMSGREIKSIAISE